MPPTCQRSACLQIDNVYAAVIVRRQPAVHGRQEYLSSRPWQFNHAVPPVRPSVPEYDPDAVTGINHDVVYLIPRRVLPGPGAGSTRPVVEHRSVQPSKSQAVFRPCLYDVVVVMGAEDVATRTGCESTLCGEGAETFNVMLGFGASSKGVGDLSTTHDVDRETDALRKPSLYGVAIAVGNWRHCQHGGGWQSPLFEQG